MLSAAPLASSNCIGPQFLVTPGTPVVFSARGTASVHKWCHDRFYLNDYSEDVLRGTPQAWNRDCGTANEVTHQRRAGSLKVRLRSEKARPEIQAKLLLTCHAVQECVHLCTSCLSQRKHLVCTVCENEASIQLGYLDIVRARLRSQHDVVSPIARAVGRNG